jgi:hypothetical protein
MRYVLGVIGLVERNCGCGHVEYRLLSWVYVVPLLTEEEVGWSWMFVVEGFGREIERRPRIDQY